MKLNFKKILLAGSALVAVAAFNAGSANAAALTFTSGANTDAVGPDTWDLAAQPGFTNSSLTFASSGNVGVTATGAGTANVGNIAVTTGGGTSTLTLGSGAVSSILIVNGNISGDVAASTVNDLNINVTAVNGGAGDSTLTFKGTTLALGSGVITLDSDNNGQAGITFSGTGAQTITGIINGAAAGDGVVSVTNTGGTVSFSSAIGSGLAVGHVGTGGSTGTTTTVFNGTVTTSNASATLGGDGAIILGQTDGGGSNTTFKGAVSTTGGGIVLGSAGATVDTNVVTFDATGANFAVTGAISAASATNNDSIVIAGGAGRTVTFNTDMGANIDSITLNASTGLSAAGSLAATTITLGTGSTLTMTGAGKSITGNITGAGTLAITGTDTLVGSATGLTALTIANAGSLAIDATAANRTLTATTTTLTGSGALNFTPATNTITVSNAIGAAVSGDGAMTIADSAGTVTFSGAVGTSLLKVGALTVATGGGANIVNVASDLFVNTTILGAGDTLNLLATTGTASGTIDGNGGAGRGSIIVGNGTAASNYTFGSAIGTTTQTVAGFKVSAASTANLSKSVATTASGGGAIGFDNEGTLNVDSTANAVTLSTATGLTKLNGTTTFSGTGAFSNTVTSATGLSIDGTLTTNVLSNAQTLTLGSGAVTTNIGINSNTTVNAGNQIVLATSGTNVIGASGRTNTLNIVKTANFDPTAQAIVLATAGTVNNAGILTVQIGAGSTALADGAQIVVIDSSANAQQAGVGTDYATQIANGKVVLQNTGLISLVDNTSTAQDLRVRAVYKNASQVLSSSANASAATSLMGNTTATGNLLTARNNLLTAPTVEAANAIAESLAPASDGAAATAALDVTDSVLGMTTMRLASLRDGSSETGMAAGNTSHGARAWGQGFGRTATQDRRNGTAGYDADTGGVAFGMDGETSNGSHVGMAVSYANTDIDSENATKTKTSVDSYQVSIYGDTPVDEHMFLNGMAAYVFNDNETTRHNVGGIAGVNANGQFDANQFVVQGELGRDFKQMNGLTLTPNVMANYSYYDAQSYTETGAGTANLNVNSDSLNALNVGVGVDAVWDIDNHDGSKLQPSLTAGYRYDLIGDSLDSNASFTGGGAAFKAQGVDPARSTLTAGAGLKYYATNNWELSARYTFDAKEDYTAHAAQLRASYKFK